MDAVDWLVNIIILLLTLAENLFTTMHFDEDYYGPVWIALVFCLEPMVQSSVQMLLKYTETEVDDFIYSLVAEVIQAWLYIRFCQYSELAWTWLSALALAQMFLITLLKIKECCTEKKEDAAEEQVKEALECATCVQQNYFVLVTSLFSLFYLLYQEDAPYRQKYYEMWLTGELWARESFLWFQGAKMQEKLFVNDEVSKFAALLQFSVSFCFQIFSAVLAWMYWFSGDITATFDKVYTMLTMICSVYFPCLFICCMSIGCALNPGETSDFFAELIGDEDEDDEESEEEWLEAVNA